MNISLQFNSFLDRLLAKTGGNYVIFAVAFSQIAASIGLLLGFISEQLNAHYTPDVVAVLRKIEIVVFPAVIITLIAIVYIISRDMRAYLDEWKQNPEVIRNEDNEKAWKDSQNIIWKYAIAAVLVSFSLVIIPKTILLITSPIASQDQVIYSLIASLISNFAFIPFSTIILDRLLVPTRRVLLPNNLSKQFSGLANIRILYKMLAVIFFSLFITALLIAPIGYHQLTRAIFGNANSREVLLDLQIQSILVSALAIFFASSLALLLARSIADPMDSLMQSFKQVEQGDLNARAPVVSSDEISKLAIYFNRMVTRLQELQSELEYKVDERTSQLKAINEVSRAATSTLDPDDLLTQVVNLIVEGFDYYYSAIYLIDQSGGWANLKAATGEAGKVYLQSGHRVEITNSNVIGMAIRSRNAKTMVDVGEKAVKFKIPLLPYTRTELALPLMVGNQVLGALDVHSSKEAAFSTQDVETLQNMANQVSISLDNARLFQETNKSLNEMRNIQKQYLREAWIDSYIPQDGVTLSVGDSSNKENINTVEVPITLREQIIGQLKLEGDEPLSADEENWIQAIATQTALALENARLLEESQSIAMREKFVTEITNKIWASTSMEGVLKTAILELGQILDATEATIELDVE